MLFLKASLANCPLALMFYNRTLNNRINRLHEKCLRIVYDDQLSSYENLLAKYGSTSVHKNNVQNLALEIYKRLNDISPEIMKDVFPLQPRTQYDSSIFLEM